MLQVLAMSGVRRIRSDQCQHGQESELGNPVKKPTGFMSNAACLLETLDRRWFGRKGLCSRPGGGEHQNCLGETARRAAIFSDQMCETILRGISLQLRSDKRLRSLEHGICNVDATVLDGNDEIELCRLRSKPTK